jgi:peptidoglycan hydrolase-like protein with peptidoglycan-binding domain
MKKSLIILAVLMTALAAWLVAFPGKNPFKGLIKKAGTTPIAINPVLPNPLQPIQTDNVPTGAFNPPPAVTDLMPGFPLSQGSRGTYVSRMQEALNNRYGSSLAVDGIFGPKTYKAVSSNGFNADAVTYNTWKQILGLA